MKHLRPGDCEPSSATAVWRGHIRSLEVVRGLLGEVVAAAGDGRARVEGGGERVRGGHVGHGRISGRREGKKKQEQAACARRRRQGKGGLWPSGKYIRRSGGQKKRWADGELTRDLLSSGEGERERV